MRCVALISGGLDSHLAARITQRQGVEQRFAKHPSCLAGRVGVKSGIELRYLEPASVDTVAAAKKNVADV
jgi:adenylyl- and sulfurtransferase ThiI